MQVPLVNLTQQYKQLKKELDEAVREVMESGNYILGKNVEMLEKEIADYCGTSHAVGVASGTDALKLSLLSLGIGKGDEVITTPFTFIATAQAITQVGATPVFVDIEEDTFNIDVEKIEKAITEKTKAILPVHLFGHTANMERILEIAKKYNLSVIEDAAQSFGSECRISTSPGKSKWKKAGSIGDAGCFSFFPTKTLGAFGDGGMVVTNREDVAEKIRLLRVHGGNSASYIYEMQGYNSRLDELQAAILRVKLRRVDEWIKIRKEKAFLYSRLLSEAPVKVPSCRSYTKHTFCVYTIRASLRDSLKEFLEKSGIKTKVYYPFPVYLQKTYKKLNCNPDLFPVTTRVCREVLSLPIYPELEEEKIFYTAQKVKEFFACNAKQKSKDKIAQAGSS